MQWRRWTAVVAVRLLDVAPELLTDALDGPAVTPVETPRAKPPPKVCSTAASAS